MKVTLIKDGPLGKAGETLEGPGVWRLAFPVKGCVAIAADPEAADRTRLDMSTVSGATLGRLVMAMKEAGTYPPESQSFATEKPKRNAERTPEPAKPGKTE